MKKQTLIISLILALALLICGCGEQGNGSSGGDGNGGNASAVKTIEQLDDWVLVRADKASQEVKDAISKLNTAIKEASGDRMSIKTDWAETGKSEIIVGIADRDICTDIESLLKTDYDYVIKSDGNAVLITGLTDRATEAAVDYFIENYIKDGKITYPKGDGYMYSFDAQIDSFKIGGADISEFKFHYIKKADSSKDGFQSTYDEVAEIANRLSDEYIGKAFEITDTDSESDRMIYFDRSGLDYEKGCIKVENGDLYLCGSYHSIGYVTDYFFDTIIGENSEIDLAEGFSVELSTDDLPTVYSKDNLMDVLEYVYNTKDLLIVGDEVNNTCQMPSTMLSNFKDGSDGTATREVCPGTGKYPSLMGLDLGRCGFKLPTLPEEQWIVVSRMVCEVVDYVADGGIVTIGCHMTNPNPDYTHDGGSEDRGEVGDEQAWRNIVIEGTPENEKFKKELELDAKVLKALDDAGVPVIWRPFHECNGGWFWWTPQQGDVQFDAKYFVDMWIYVYEFFTEEKGLKNLIWEYSPSTSTHMDVMYLYPGDEYCDLVGIDWYTSGDFEIVNTDFYERLMATGKVTNLAEIGPGSSLMADTQAEQEKLYTAWDLIGNAFSMYYEDYQIGYFMTYAGHTSLMWLPGGDEVMADKRILDLSEMLPLFEEVTGFKK